MREPFSNPHHSETTRTRINFHLYDGEPPIYEYLEPYKYRGVKKRRPYRPLPGEIFRIYGGTSQPLYAVSTAGNFADLYKSKLPDHKGEFYAVLRTPPKNTRWQASINGKPTYVYRLIASVFVKNQTGLPDDQCQVHHKNQDFTDNSAANLTWVKPNALPDPENGITGTHDHATLDKITQLEMWINRKWKRTNFDTLTDFLKIPIDEVIAAIDDAFKTSTDRLLTVVIGGYKFRITRRPPRSEKSKKTTPKKRTRKRQNSSNRSAR